MKKINLESYINNNEMTFDEKIKKSIYDQVLNELGILDDNNDNIKIDINPFKQRASITLFPDENSSFQFLADLKKEIKLEVKFSHKF